MTTKTKTVSEYRSRFTNPNTNNVLSITSESLESLQKDVRMILGSTVQFDPNGDNNNYLIQLRDQHLGWISRQEVPENMSIKHINSLTIVKAA